MAGQGSGQEAGGEEAGPTPDVWCDPGATRRLLCASFAFQCRGQAGWQGPRELPRPLRSPSPDSHAPMSAPPLLPHERVDSTRAEAVTLSPLCPAQSRAQHTEGAPRLRKEHCE